MNFADGMEVIDEAQRRISDDKLFLRWALGYQAAMRFEDFKQQVMPASQHTVADNRSVEDILNEVRRIANGDF